MLSDSEINTATLTIGLCAWPMRTRRREDRDLRCCLGLGLMNSPRSRGGRLVTTISRAPGAPPDYDRCRPSIGAAHDRHAAPAAVAAEAGRPGSTWIRINRRVFIRRARVSL